MIVNKYTKGGGGSGSGVTPEQVQAQIDSALTPFWDSANTESAITAAVSGKADAKIMVDFDHTTQAERASVYADLYALYSGGSGATINKTYDFFKTVNTWQGLKIDYYGFSADTLVFGKVVSPENLTDQVVYEQVMTIDSAGTVNVVTNTVGGGVSQEYVDSAVTILQNQLNEIDEVIPAAIVDLNERVDGFSDIELPISAAVNKLKGDFEARLDQQYYKKQEVNNLLKEKLTAEQVDVQIKNYTDPLFQAVYETIEDKELPISAALNELNEAIDLIDEVVPAALVNLNETKVGSDSVHTIWRGTQAAYDAITTKDASTLYIIVNE